MMLRAQRIAVILFVTATLGASCSSSAQSSGPTAGRLLVVATTSIWADVVSSATCNELVEVKTLVPPGLSAHEFEPSLRDRGELDGADLIVANGLGIEQGFDPTLDASSAAGARLFRIAETATGLITDADGNPDPHVWLDPSRVASTLPALESALVESGVAAEPLSDCARDYAGELADLDSEVASILSRVPAEKRKLVTNHDALAYFADHYHFELVGSVLPSNLPLAEAQSADIASLIEKAKAAGIDTVFTEETVASGDAETVARAAGASLVPLLVESLGSGDGSVSTYPDLLRSNAIRIADALG